MKIRFDLELQDLVAFVCYHEDHTPSVRWIRRIVNIIGIGVLLVVPALLVPEQYRIAALIGSTLGVLIGIPRMRGAHARNTERRVRRQYRGVANASLFGRHELELTDTTLIKRTDVNESATKLEALGPVVVTKDYAFIYASPTTAFVIPRRSVGSGDFDQFAEEATKRVAAANPYTASARSRFG